MIQKKEDIVIIIYSHFKNSYKNCDILRQQRVFLVLIFNCPFFFDSLANHFQIIPIPATGSVPTIISRITTAIISHVRISENDDNTYMPTHTHIIRYKLSLIAQNYFPAIFLCQSHQYILLFLRSKSCVDVMQFERILLIPISDVNDRNRDGRKQYGKSNS